MRKNFAFFAQSYNDDGIQAERVERTIEEEGDDLRNILLSEGHDWEEASYAKHMWEKD